MRKWRWIYSRSRSSEKSIFLNILLTGSGKNLKILVYKAIQKALRQVDLESSNSATKQNPEVFFFLNRWILNPYVDV